MTSRVGAGSDGRVPLPAVVSPYVAAWLVRRSPEVVRGMREAGARMRLAGYEGQGRQLEQACEQVVESARQHYEWVARETGGSVDGSAEVGLAGVGSGSGVSIGTPSTLSSAEAGSLLGCSSRWVGHLIASGVLSGRKQGRAWVVDRESVEALRQTRSAG